MDCSHPSATRMRRAPVAAALLALALTGAPAAAVATPAAATPTVATPTVATPTVATPAASAPAVATPAASAATAATSAATSRAVEAAEALVSRSTVTTRPHAASRVTASAVRGPALLRGQTLAPGDSLVSPSGQYSLIMDPDGSVLLQKAANRLAGPYAEALFVGAPGSRLVLQDDGNLVLLGFDNSVYDDLGTAGTTASSLRVQDDGNLVLYGASSSVVYNFDTADPELLFDGGTLLPGEQLRSDDGGTTLLMQADGNLVLYTRGVVRFASGTRSPGAAAVLQEDGNFVVYSTTNQPLFNTRTSSAPYDFNLLLVSDREFRVFGIPAADVTAPVLFGSAWGTSVVEPGMVLLRGDRRTAPGGVLLVFQTDGNLVEYVNGRAVFATRTSADLALMQPDGNFVLYVEESDGDVVPVFSTGTNGFPGSRLVVQSDGNVVVYTPANRAVFATRR